MGKQSVWWRFRSECCGLRGKCQRRVREKSEVCSKFCRVSAVGTKRKDQRGKCERGETKCVVEVTE